MRLWLVLPLIGGCVIVSETDKDVAAGTGDTGITTTTPPDDTGDTGLTTPPDPDDDNDGFPASVDCDDANPDINPDAIEICDAVDNNCDGTADDAGAATILPATNYPSFDEAISAAIADDQVAVCAGVHSTVGVAADISLSIFGVGPDAAATTLTSAVGDPLLTHGTPGTATLTLLTLTGATGPDGALALIAEGVVVTQDVAISDNTTHGVTILGTNASLTLTDTTISGNVANDEGGAIQAFGTFDIAVTGGEISGNSASLGGGIYAEVTFGTGSVTLTDATITGNSANTGGGLMVLNVPVVGSGINVIEANTALVSGGGIATVRSPVDGVSVLANDAPLGGGIAVVADPAFALAPLAPDLTEVILSGNVADQGAGLYIDRGESVVLSSAVSAMVDTNVAATTGGGAYLSPQSSLESIGMDWTVAGATDNSPDDVWTPAGAFIDLGPDFVCTGIGGCL